MSQVARLMAPGAEHQVFAGQAIQQVRTRKAIGPDLDGAVRRTVK